MARHATRVSRWLSHGARDPLRAQWRRPHRLSGARRRPDRSGLRPELDLPGRALLGGADRGAVLRPARIVLAADHVRSAGVGTVGPGRGRADARGADGRRCRGDGCGRLRAGGGVRACSTAGAMARCSPPLIPSAPRALVLYEAHAADVAGRPTTTGRCAARSAGVHRNGGLGEWGTGSRILALSPSGRRESSPATVVRAARAARRESRNGGEADADERARSMSAPCCRRSRPRRWSCTGPTTSSSTSATPVISPTHIPGARYVELPGDEALTFGARTATELDEIEEFLTGARHAVGLRADPRDGACSRTSSTRPAARRRSATAAGATCSSRSRRAIGRELIAGSADALVKAMGDGVLATFDGPARAIRCATAIRDVAGSQFGLEVRSRPAHRRDRADRQRRRRDRRAHRAPGCGRAPVRARCSSRARSRTWSSAQGSRSRIAASVSSRASRAPGGCGRWPASSTW